MPLVGDRDQQQVLRIVDQVGEEELALALDGAPVAERQQPREPAPALAGRGIGDDVWRAVGEGEARADDQAEIDREPVRCRLLARVAERDMGLHHPRHGVAVGDADRLVPERDRMADHVRGMRGAAQKAVIGRRHQLGEADALAHANNPWMYQSGAVVSWP